MYIDKPSDKVKQVPCCIKKKRKECKILLITIIALIVNVIFCSISFAHSGRTDSQGGHHDRINGGYHYHHGYSAHDHPDGICPYDKRPEPSEREETDYSGRWFVGSAIVAIIIIRWIYKKKS